MSEPPKGGELFIVDNSDESWKGLRYLQDWTEIASSFDIATGFFEIGSLLALDGKWQKLDSLRILMGDQAPARTRQAILEALRKHACRKLDASLEAEKEANDMLVGAAAIVEAMRQGKIQCRVYAKRKFHAKAYITHPRLAVVGSVALVGSSNFTLPGLTENIELNIQIRAPGDVSQLQAWYERHWQEAEDITPDILKVIERHIREYTPFDIYAKAMQEFHRGHEMTDDEWEKAGSQSGGSAMYPILDKYQQDGYKSLMKIARLHRGAFLCDGVGLGKTFIGLMLIERLVIRDRQRVVLIVPKAAREPV
ncbi:MAG TPA: phospholipase D-like domain-containing protein, partial [Dongiaceae bacterium]|nr:phospholipase D-like domain-containing protein [Dongiaceae bacterium]